MQLRLLIAVFVFLPAIARGADEAVPRTVVGSAALGVQGTLGAVISLAVVVSLGWLLYRFIHYRNERARHDPRNLLHELCQVHGLSRRAERVLRKAAAAVGTPYPGRFFLEPTLLDRACHCEQLKAHKRALGLLYERLFGEDE